MRIPAAALLLSLLGLLPPQEPAPAPSGLRILVTNDDGIDAAGLHALVKALDPLGEVVVSAPEQNCSGASHSSVAFGEALQVGERTIEGAELARAVSGKPVDAVAYGVLELGKERKFDVVVSGINAGSNVGLVAHYSGTVGAAVEGALRGLPSVAVSLERRGGDIEAAAAFTARFVARLMAEKPAAGIVYSINVPAGKPGEVAVAPMGGMYVDLDGFAQQADGAWRAHPVLRREAPAGCDTQAYFDGKITVTPLRVDWTDSAEVARLGGWKLH